MMQLSPDTTINNRSRFGGQPIALAGLMLFAILAATAAIASWRAYTGHSPELDRVVAARQQQQVRAAQASEQLAAKTNGLEITQQESIDQLQLVQDQLQTLRQQFVAQQADTKRLSDQISVLTDAVENLRHSFASAQPAESGDSPAAKKHPAHARAHAHAVRTAPQKHAKSHG